MSPQRFRTKIHGTSDNGVVFFFCPFGLPGWLFALPFLPIWHYVRHGYQVVVYSYDLKVVTNTPHDTIATIEAVVADTGQRIQAGGNNTRYIAHGTSIGTGLAANVGARHKQVSKVILNLSYADIAEHFLHMPTLLLIPPKTVRKYINSGGGAAGLRQLFQAYSPLHLVDQLGHAEVLLYLARRDRIFKYQHTKKLVGALRSANVVLHYYENRRANHVLGSLRNHLQFRRYIDFVKR